MGALVGRLRAAFDGELGQVWTDADVSPEEAERRAREERLSAQEDKRRSDEVRRNLDMQANTCEESLETQEKLQRLSALLASKEFNAAQNLLAELLQLMDSRQLLVQDTPALGAAILNALSVLKDLEGAPQQKPLAWLSVGLTALTALKAAENPELYKNCRNYLYNAVKLIETAWQPWGALANQSVDDNRFVFSLSATLMAKEPDLRPALAGLVTTCTSTSLAILSFWNARFFDSNMQGVLVAFEYSHLEESWGMQTSAAHLAEVLLYGCHVAPSSQTNLMDRVITFLKSWERRGIDIGLHSANWLFAASKLVPLQVLPEGGFVAPLTPVACFVAFFLDWRSCNGTDVSSEERLIADLGNALGPWLSKALQQHTAVSTTRGDILLRGFVACKASQWDNDSIVNDSGFWLAVASALCSLVCEILLPVKLLKDSVQDLQRHQSSAICRLLPDVADGLARCLDSLDRGKHAELIVARLEALCCEWSTSWCSLSAASQSSPLHGWFGAAVFLLISTVLRRANLAALAPDALFLGLRGLAHVELFREDTGEFRALCSALAQVGAGTPDFVEKLLNTLLEFHSSFRGMSESQAAHQDGPSEHDKASPNASMMMECHRIHFILGVLADPVLIKSDGFFPTVWPIIVDCIRACPEDEHSPRAQLAFRAQGLACVCLDEAGTKGVGGIGADGTKEYISACLSCFGFGPSDLLAAGINAVAKDLSLRMSSWWEDGERSAADANEARALQEWLLQQLGNSILAKLRDAHFSIAEDMFRALCAAASHVDESLVPEPLYSESKLLSILAVHAPMRKIWVTALVTSFAETSKEKLVSRLLRDFPGCVAASCGVAAEREALLQQSGAASLGLPRIQSAL